MATITKNFQNGIVVQCDNSTAPATFLDIKDAILAWGTETEQGNDGEYVSLTIGNQGFHFGSLFANPVGPLTAVNGIDVTGFTAEEIYTLIQNSVLTDDKFSGTPTIISDTNQHTGPFTAVQIDATAVFNVTPVSGTIVVDGNGDPIDISDWSGVMFPALMIKYGNFSKLQLASGTVTAYSNL